VSRIEIDWPSGQVQTFEDLAPNQLINIDETRGLVAPR
jgi:hypothetical protein